MKIESLLRNPGQYYGHIDGSNKKIESLPEHIKTCTFYYEQLKKYKDVDQIYKNIYRTLFNDERSWTLFIDLADAVVDHHDDGKINPLYQRKILANPSVDGDLGIQTEHSILSAILYVYFYLSKIKKMNLEENMELKFAYIIFINSYVISRHHSDLNNFKYKEENYLNLFKDRDSSFFKILEELDKENIFKEDFFQEREENIYFIRRMKLFISRSVDMERWIKENQYTLFIYIRLLYSLLVASDFYATTNYMSGYNPKTADFDYEQLKEIYNNSDLLKCIRDQEKAQSYLKIKNMNELRTKIFLEVEKNFKKEKKSKIYFLESPTGSGKSNIAMNLSYQLLGNKKNKIIYAYPFNTLVEQNKEILEDYYKKTSLENQIAVVNSITPIGQKLNGEASEEIEKNEEIGYIKSLLDRQFLHAPFVVTSNVALFQILFSNRRQNIFGTYQLINSVIVLDEIQAYREEIWPEIIDMLNSYGELFNINFIIMSATLPDLSTLLDKEKQKGIIQLVHDKKELFGHPFFKDRVSLNYDLVDRGKIEYLDLLEHMKKHIQGCRKVVLEFISRKNAEEFYSEIKQNGDFLDYKVLILTGADNMRVKKNVIEFIKNMEENHKVILVATQVIEAGVDIDMDLGYKDISKLENEEQFLGRINRSGRKERATTYFFDIANEKNIYGHIDEELTLRNVDRRRDLKEKDFYKYFSLKLSKAKEDKEDGAYKNFLRNLNTLQLEKVAKHMELIKNNKEEVQVFLARKIVVDGKEVDGAEVWREYLELLKNQSLSYSKKMVELSYLKARMSDFLYKTERCYQNRPVTGYQDVIGNMYYYEEGEKYLDNERLNKEIYDNPLIL